MKMVSPVSWTLLASFFLGLFYVFFIPPWQHYDEPSHLEYAILLARLNRAPRAADASQELRLSIAQSMLEHGFYDTQPAGPNLNPPAGQLTDIGYSQWGGPQLYYWFVSIPLRLAATAPILTQLYLARLVSLVFLVLGVWAAALVAAELFPEGRLLRWLLPAFLALFPAYLDAMSAVNTDAAAIAAAGFALWLCLRILRRGLSLPLALAALGAAALAVIFKETAVFTLPVAGLALWFGLLRGRRWLAWAGLGAALAAALALGLRFDDAALWPRATTQDAPLRAASAQAVWGEYVFQVDASAARTPDWSAHAYQPLAGRVLAASTPVTATVGAWMWASEPLAARSVIVGAWQQRCFSGVELTTQPQFFAFECAIVGGASGPSYVALAPSKLTDHPVMVYYDGVVAAQGRFALDEAPQFSDAQASGGTWGGQPFTNLVRNASAEQPGLRLQPWLDRQLARFLPDNTLPSVWLVTPFDQAGAGYYFRLTGAHLFRTFWGQLGWGHIPLAGLGSRPYRIPGLATAVLAALTLGALAVSAYQQGRAFPWEALFLVFVSLAVTWGVTVLRGALYVGQVRLFIPVARYTFPAIIPALLLLLTGGGLAAQALSARWKPAGWLFAALLGVFLLLLQFAALLGVAQAFGL